MDPAEKEQNLAIEEITRNITKRTENLFFSKPCELENYLDHLYRSVKHTIKDIKTSHTWDEEE